jgi:hypothetical protein
VLYPTYPFISKWFISIPPFIADKTNTLDYLGQISRWFRGVKESQKDVAIGAEAGIPIQGKTLKMTFNLEFFHKRSERCRKSKKM